MTVKLSDLSVLAYANNFTLWHYSTADDSITGANDFDKASDMLRINDLIIASYDTDGTGTGPTTDFFVVTGNSGGVVTVQAYT